VQGMRRDGIHDFVEGIRNQCSAFGGIGSRRTMDLSPLITDYSLF
jgi:hypothetical protein